MLRCGGVSLKKWERKRRCQGAEGKCRGPNDEGGACHRVISLEECRLSNRQICLCLHLLFYTGLAIFRLLSLRRGARPCLVVGAREWEDGETCENAA